MANTELQEQLHSKKDDVLELINSALRVAGLDVDLASISFRAIKRSPVCPPGQVPVWEAVEHNGTVTYQWVCKQQ